MSVFDDIKARLDIVDVVSGYVTLQKAGRSFKAPCPFHNERTPSFIVNPDRQTWHCFGACSTGGDVIGFVMKADNLEIGDALRTLAQKAGVELTPQNKENSDKRNALHQVNQLAASFYQEQLKAPKGKKARAYVEKRGLNAEAIEKFQIGYSLEDWDGLKTYLTNMGIPEDQAVEAGLVYRNEEDRTWDFFRGRLMFPIHDKQGRVAGFGGRSMDSEEERSSSENYNPKYLNTSATAIFDKRRTLYALHLANDSIKEKNIGIVVEGYMDVIAAHQHGYTNVVASMGTALTEDQVNQLKSSATNFVLAMDPDVAGQEATLRSLEASWKVIGNQMAASRNSSVGVLYQRDPIILKIAALPDGKDPDELIRHDPKEWERLTENAVPLMDYLIPAIAARFDISTGQGKTQVVETVFPLIAASDNTFDQELYIEKLADTLGVTVEAVKASLPRAEQRGGQGRRSQRPKQEVSGATLTSNPEGALEDYTLSLLLTKPELKDLILDFAPEHFHKSEDREVFTQWLTCSTIDDLRVSLDESLHSHLDGLLAREMAPIDRVEAEKALAQCCRRMEIRHQKEQLEVLTTSEDNSVPPPREREEDVVTVNARLKELFVQTNR